MKKLVIKIKYRSSSQTTTSLHTKSIQFAQSACKYYFNAQHFLITLGAEARSFLDYLCEQMDAKTNRIIISRELRQSYVSFIRQVTSNRTKPKDGSLTQYVSKFKKLGLILPEAGNGSGYYVVNPKYFYKESENKRKLLLQELIQKRIKENKSLFGLLPQDEVDFFSQQ